MRVKATAPRGKLSLREAVGTLTLGSTDSEEAEDLAVLLKCLIKNGGSFLLTAAAKQFLGLPPGPHKTNDLNLGFATDEDREEFLGWFLDGGGEYQHNESRECHDMKGVQSVMIRFGDPPKEDEPDHRRIEAIEFKPYEDG